jgi:hypothetical protein
MSNNYGLNDSLQYIEIELDSLDTTNSPDAASATTDWPLFMFGRPLSNVAAVKILEVQIPFTFYIFNSGNNTFVMNIAGFGNTTVTIPEGNYTSGTIVTALNTALASAIAFLGIGGYAVTASYVAATGKLRFTTSDNGTIITFTFGTSTNSGNDNPRLYLGFNAGPILSSSNGSVQVINAPNVVLLTGPNYLYINSTTLGQLCNVYLPLGAVNVGGGNSGPQMAKVPINVLPGNVIFWQDPGTFLIYQ